MNDVGNRLAFRSCHEMILHALLVVLQRKHTSAALVVIFPLRSAERHLFDDVWDSGLQIFEFPRWVESLFQHAPGRLCDLGPDPGVEELHFSITVWETRWILYWWSEACTEDGFLCRCLSF